MAAQPSRAFVEYQRGPSREGPQNQEGTNAYPPPPRVHANADRCLRGRHLRPRGRLRQCSSPARQRGHVAEFVARAVDGVNAVLLAARRLRHEQLPLDTPRHERRPRWSRCNRARHQRAGERRPEAADGFQRRLLAPGKRRPPVHGRRLVQVRLTAGLLRLPPQPLGRRLGLLGAVAVAPAGRRLDAC